MVMFYAFLLAKLKEKPLHKILSRIAGDVMDDMVLSSK